MHRAAVRQLIIEHRCRQADHQIATHADPGQEMERREPTSTWHGQAGSGDRLAAKPTGKPCPPSGSQATRGRPSQSMARPSGGPERAGVAAACRQRGVHRLGWTRASHMQALRRLNPTWAAEMVRGSPPSPHQCSSCSRLRGVSRAFEWTCRRHEVSESAVIPSWDDTPQQVSELLADEHSCGLSRSVFRLLHWCKARDH